MYTIEVLQHYLEHFYLYATDRKGLFCICWLLEHDEQTKQFLVYDNLSLTLPEYFGFGRLSKWSERLDYANQWPSFQNGV